MTAQSDNMAPRRMWRIPLWGGLALVLLLPALAMQVTSEVNWTPLDFVVMGALLATLGFGIELTMRMVRGSWARICIGAAIVFVFLMIWAELAVGVFGTPFAGS